MDTTDLVLISAILKDPLGTHANWASIIGRSASTVRSRLTVLKQSGVLRRFTAIPNGAALGAREVGAAWATSKALGELLSVPDTVYAGATVDGVVTIGAWTNDSKTWLEAMNQLTGSEPLRPLMEASYNGPVLGLLDLRVLRAMLDDPRAPASELSEACGLSAKTVRRHRAVILDSRAIRVSPNLKMSAAKSIVSHLHVHCGGEDIARVHEALEGSTPGYQDCPYVCIFDLCSTVGDQAERIEMLRKLGFPVDVVHERDELFSQDRIRRWVDAAIARWRLNGRASDP